MIAQWNQTAFPTALSNYKLVGILNVNGFCLFHNCLPNKNLRLQGEKCVRGINSKVRLIDMLAASAFGAKLPMFKIER